MLKIDGGQSGTWSVPDVTTFTSTNGNDASGEVCMGSLSSHNPDSGHFEDHCSNSNGSSSNHRQSVREDGSTSNNNDLVTSLGMEISGEFTFPSNDLDESDDKNYRKRLDALRSSGEKSCLSSLQEQQGDEGDGEIGRGSLLKKLRRSSTKAITPSPRKSNDLSDFTIDKLNYAALEERLYGREEEVAILKERLDRMMMPQDNNTQEEATSCRSRQRQLILIGGNSGTGKTKLASSLEKALERKEQPRQGHTNIQDKPRRRNGLYVSGKFDLNRRNMEPYSGIAAACAQMCGALLELKNHSSDSCQFDCISRQIREELGSELSLLIKVFPVLLEVVESDTFDETASSVSTTSNQSTMRSPDDNKNRLHFAFIRFLRIISQQFEPLILTLDDLQWADQASLHLMEAIMTHHPSSNKTKKLMVIGIYRSNEVQQEEGHIFNQTLENLVKKSQDKDGVASFELTQIEIDNLSEEAVHHIIQDLLACDDDECNTLSLARICYAKTLGNVFFLLQFLAMLHQQRLLEFNFNLLTWTWDEEEIEKSTNASDNVVDLLRAKMSELSQDLIKILLLAAFLGSTFEVHVLRLVWTHLHADSNDNPLPSPEQCSDSGEASDSAQAVNDPLLQAICSLQKAGYVTLLHDTASDKPQRHDLQYKWSHDKIHEAAVLLIADKAERAAFAGRIGKILISKLDKTELDGGIFVVVDLLNKGFGGRSYKQDNDEDMYDHSIRVAELNKTASKKAMGLSAFESAAEYARQGIAWLPQNSWKEHYQLSLALFSVGAKAEGCIGNVDTMEAYCKEVMKQEGRSVEDKFEVYDAWIDSLTNRNLVGDAADLLFDILSQFKCRFPKKKSSLRIGVGIVGNLLSVKATLKSRNVDQLTKMKDTTRTMLMKFLDRLVTCLYLTDDSRMPLVVFRTLNWTIKYGYCDFSCVALSTTGLMLTGVLDDLQGGSTYGEQALKLIQKSKSQTSVARTQFVVYFFVYCWTKPFRELLKPLMQTYELGLKSGDTESAMYAMVSWLLFQLYDGKPLTQLSADFALYLKQMYDLKRYTSVDLCLGPLQAINNLRGIDNLQNPTSIEGKIMTKEMLKRYEESGKVPTHNYPKAMLLAYFGEHVELADWAIKSGYDNELKAHVASASNMPDFFLKGVACFSAASRTGKKKYIKTGQLYRSRIKKWLDMGCHNVVHYESLLDAQWKALKGKHFAALKQYKVAVLLAARGGHMQDAALASEMFAEFLLKKDMNDTDEAIYRIRESIKYWKEWGAIAKVDALEKKYADLLKQPTPDHIFAMRSGHLQAD